MKAKNAFLQHSQKWQFQRSDFFQTKRDSIKKVKFFLFAFSSIDFHSDIFGYKLHSEEGRNVRRTKVPRSINSFVILEFYKLYSTRHL